MVETDSVKNIKVGDKITIGNIDWCAANRMGDTISFISEKVIGVTIWDVPRFTIGANFAIKHGYAKELEFRNTIIHDACINIESLISAETDFSLVRNETLGVRVHAPTKEQLLGGWIYFTNESNRRCNNSFGYSTSYWTASTSNPQYIWYVSAGGALNLCEPNTMLGFRPAFTIRI